MTNHLQLTGLDPSTHPCFNEKSRCETSRVHLPVASRCNMQCNFCDRKYCCVNESRPGVTSSMLKPWQALEYVHHQVGRLQQLKVVGIAGPGDPFANPDETLETFRLVRQAYPEMLLCVATNGLAILEHLPALKELQVSHVTITVNAVDPNIGQQIYSWIRYGKRTHSGIEAAEYLWNQQEQSIRALSDIGILIKINSIYIPGINDYHIGDIAQKVSQLGAQVLNIMALKPTKNTMFSELPEPTNQEVARVRLKAREYLPQMSHCSRCRADAAGLIGQIQTSEDRQILSEYSKKTQPRGQGRVAVATLEGYLVNQHLGEASDLWIYERKENQWTLLEQRPCPEPGGGADRWESLAQLIHDCQVLLVSGIGPGPQQILEKHLKVEVVEGLITPMLDLVSQGQGLSTMRKTKAFSCGSECSGTGGGCG
jgi:nitrogen fixation protein NifB